MPKASGISGHEGDLSHVLCCRMPGGIDDRSCIDVCITGKPTAFARLACHSLSMHRSRRCRRQPLTMQATIGGRSRRRRRHGSPIPCASFGTCRSELDSTCNAWPSNGPGGRCEVAGGCGPYERKARISEPSLQHARESVATVGTRCHQASRWHGIEMGLMGAPRASTVQVGADRFISSYLNTRST